MNRFEPTNESGKKVETLETHEAPHSVEKSTEEIRAQMFEQSEKEVADFQREGTAELAQAEARAEKDGLVIDAEDRLELQGLNGEAEHAKSELVNKIEEKETASLERIEALEKAKKKIQDMQQGGRANSSEYFDLYSYATQGFGENLTWRNAEEIEPEKIDEMFLAIERSGMETKERVMEEAKLLSAKEASKSLLNQERSELAREFWEQRRFQRERLSKLKGVIDIAQEKIQGERGDEQLGRILQLQASEASLMAERISTEDMTQHDMQEEKENLEQLIEGGETSKSIKQKLEEHYVKAEIASRERYDTLNRSVEHVMQRNNAFIIHKIAEKKGVRHNANSNVSEIVTYEDDLDIMLALEPSISASSLTPGEKTNFWQGDSGFLLGGGQIGEADNSDIGTEARGIKNRGGKKSSIEKIDKIVGRKGDSGYERFGEHGMNELVINNPEVFGYFQNAKKDEEGNFWMDMNDVDAKYYAENSQFDRDYREALKANVEVYRNRFALASERGIPLFVMSNNKDVYECLSVNDNGIIEVGKKIKPEDVALGRAGLSAQKRKEIGERILQKKLFKKDETMQEAREIIQNL